MGQGYEVKCPVCGHKVELILGIGFTDPLIAIQERENILAGEYGPKAQTALETHPEALVKVEMAPYQCGVCGKVESRIRITVKPPIGVPIPQRCDCGAKLRLIRRNGKVFCPSCGKPMAPTGERIQVLWD